MDGDRVPLHRLRERELLGLAAAVSSGLGTVLKGPFAELGGCSQLGGGWSSPLQRGRARFIRGPEVGTGKLQPAGPQIMFAKRLLVDTAVQVRGAVQAVVPCHRGARRGDPVWEEERGAVLS